MRRILEEDKRSIDSSIGQLKGAKASTDQEIALRKTEQSDNTARC
jgi:beta-lactamase class A